MVVLFCFVIPGIVLLGVYLSNSLGGVGTGTVYIDTSESNILYSTYTVSEYLSIYVIRCSLLSRQAPQLSEKQPRHLFTRGKPKLFSAALLLNYI